MADWCIQKVYGEYTNRLHHPKHTFLNQAMGELENRLGVNPGAFNLLQL